MDFSLTEIQQELQRVSRDFATKELIPRARAWDEHHTWPAEAVAKMSELGLMGMMVPEEWGGSGLDAVSYAIALEEVSRGCASSGVIMSVNNSLYCDALRQFGSDEQKRTWLTPFARGERLGCFGLTEPQAGSDAAAQETTAVRKKDSYVINGSKNWITNGPHADAILLFTMTDKAAKSKGISVFIVPLESPGVRRAPPDSKLGICAAHSCSLYFDDVVVPASARVGEEGHGFKVAMATLDGGRIGIAAQAIGIAQAAYEEALAYSGERATFGKPIRDHQAIAFKLADMATELAAARLLVRAAALKKDAKQRYSKEASMAKLYASEMSHRVTHAALQVFGGMGYSKECNVERHYRDARITEIYEGTSEIQRLVIANSVLKE